MMIATFSHAFACAASLGRKLATHSTLQLTDIHLYLLPIMQGPGKVWGSGGPCLRFQGGRRGVGQLQGSRMVSQVVV